MCVAVCSRETERDREKEREIEIDALNCEFRFINNKIRAPEVLDFFSFFFLPYYPLE
jgi:hypothetical protein